ncbi:MAG: hypothetical protein KF724_00865 [Phycisphaeraceae bacterium]|nr:hypothetical protein [Phycisphaeraceae bacterium]
MRGKSCLGAVMTTAAVTVGFATSANADQEFGWSHTWTYIQGPIFDDFHATYSGTGGTIDRVVLTLDTAGGGIISPNFNTIDIEWPDTWVMPGDSFTYTFNTAFSPVQFEGGTITKQGQVIGFVEIDGTVRAATGAPIGFFEHSFVPAPGAAILLLAAGVTARRRRSV